MATKSEDMHVDSSINGSFDEDNIGIKTEVDYEYKATRTYSSNYSPTSDNLRRRPLQTYEKRQKDGVSPKTTKRTKCKESKIKYTWCRAVLFLLFILLNAAGIYLICIEHDSAVRILTDFKRDVAYNFLTLTGKSNHGKVESGKKETDETIKIVKGFSPPDHPHDPVVKDEIKSETPVANSNIVEQSDPTSIVNHEEVVDESKNSHAVVDEINKIVVEEPKAEEANEEIVPKEIAEAVPDESVAATSEGISEAAPTECVETPDIAFKESAKIPSEETSDAVPKESTRIVSEETSDVVPTESTETTSEETPEVASKESAEVPSEENPVAAPKELTETTSEETPEVVHKESSETASEERPEVEPEESAKMTSEIIHEVEPAEKTSEETPKLAPKESQTNLYEAPETVPVKVAPQENKEVKDRKNEVVAEETTSESAAPIEIKEDVTEETLAVDQEEITDSFPHDDAVSKETPEIEQNETIPEETKEVPDEAPKEVEENTPIGHVEKQPNTNKDMKKEGESGTSEKQVDADQEL